MIFVHAQTCKISRSPQDFPLSDLVEAVADDAVGLPPVGARTEREAQLLRVLPVPGHLTEVLGCPAEPETSRKTKRLTLRYNLTFIHSDVNRSRFESSTMRFPPNEFPFNFSYFFVSHI